MQTTIRKPFIYGLGIIALLFSLSMSAYWAYWAYGVFVFRSHASVAHDKLATAVRASDEKAFKSLIAEHVSVRLHVRDAPFDSAPMSQCLGQPKALLESLRGIHNPSEIFAKAASAKGGLIAWLDRRGAWVAVPDALMPAAARHGPSGYVEYASLAPITDRDSKLFFALTKAHDAETYKLSRIALYFSSEQAAQSFSAKAASWCDITPSLGSGY